MMYWKSTETNQIYKTDFIPMGKGWELSTETEYFEYLANRGY